MKAYTLLPLIPIRPWDELSMDFIMAYHGAQLREDAIMVAVDRFFKVAHFVVCHEAYHVLHC